MRNLLKPVLFFFTVFTYLFASVPVAVPAFAQPDLDAFTNARMGQLLVRFKGSENPQLFQFESNWQAARALIDFSKEDGVDIVQPNFIYKASAQPNDAQSVSQDYLQVVNAYEAWNDVDAAQDVVVAVIDSGIDQTHPDLRGNLWENALEIPGNGVDDDNNGFIDDLHGWDFISDVGDASPKIKPSTSESAVGAQHGTIVGGLIGAVGNNGVGVAGIAWRTQLMNIRVLDLAGLGDSKRITEGFAYALENGADVINMSLVGTDYDPVLVDLLRRAHQENVITVAAAGNNNRTLNQQGAYPICYKGQGDATVIGVGAIDNFYKKASFSNYGSNCVDIVAPGVDIFSTRAVRGHFTNQNYYDAIFSGTSFSTPLVSGAVALMKQAYPDLTPDEALAFLQDGSIPITDDSSKSYGFEYALDIAGALDLTLEKVDSLPPPSTPQFLALPRSPYHTFGYRYQLPGPILVDPLVLDNEELKAGGINITRESGTTVLLSRWDKDARTVYRYNTKLGTVVELFRTDREIPDQSVGSIAIGNVDFDEDQEYVVVGGPESTPKVTIFRGDGVLKYQFDAYDADITGGMHVALFDTNFDGVSEIVTVPATQRSGHIKVFDYTGLLIRSWKAYSENFDGGANLTIADIDTDGVEELVVGPGVTGGPHVKVFNGDGSLKLEFFGGALDDNGGAHVQVLDLDQDNQDEFIITYHEGRVPVIRRYTLTGMYIDELGIFDPGYTGGVTIIAD